MTLIVSEVSKWGIAMAADSAETSACSGHWDLRLPQPVIRTGVEKLVIIDAIGAALAGWGPASLGEGAIPVDLFLQDFASQVKKGTSLQDAGTTLATRVNELVPPERLEGGFHVTGYAEEAGVRFPAVYSVHPDDTDGRMALHLDWPKKHWQPYETRGVKGWIEELEAGTFAYIFNGETEMFRKLQESLYGVYAEGRRDVVWGAPRPEALEVRGKLLKLLVETTADLYRLSGHYASISRPVSWLTIGEDGIESYFPANY